MFMPVVEFEAPSLEQVKQFVSLVEQARDKKEVDFFVLHVSNLLKVVHIYHVYNMYKLCSLLSVELKSH